MVRARISLTAALALWSAGVAVLTATPQAIAQGIIDDLAAPDGAIGAPAPLVKPAAGLREQLSIDEIQPAWNKPKPADGQVSPGIRIWQYSPTEIERLRVRAASWTMVYFPEWEQIEDFYVGDPDAFEVTFPTTEDGRVTRRNVLLIRPSAGVVAADTSLQVIGASFGERRNVYTAYLRSEKVKADAVSEFTVFVQAPRPVSAGGVGSAGAAPVRAMLPSGSSGQPLPAEKAAYRVGAPGAGRDAPDGGRSGPEGGPDYLRTIPIDLAAVRFGDYQVFAKDDESRTIQPVRVFNDGHFTFLDFGENGRSDRLLRPVVYRVVDGINTMVNTRTTGPEYNILVVESVGYDLALMNGERIVCIKYVGHDLEPIAGQRPPEEWRNPDESHWWNPATWFSSPSDARPLRATVPAGAPQGGAS